MLNKPHYGALPWWGFSFLLQLVGYPGLTTRKQTLVFLKRLRFIRFYNLPNSDSKGRFLAELGSTNCLT